MHSVSAGEVSGPVASTTSPGRNLEDLLTPNLDEWMALDGGRHTRREALAIDGQSSPRRDRRAASRGDDERTERLHLSFEQSGGVLGIVAAQRVAAHQFRQITGLVRRRRPLGPHLVQNHRNAALGELEGALAAGQAGTDDGDGSRGSGHRGDYTKPSRRPFACAVSAGHPSPLLLPLSLRRLAALGEDALTLFAGQRRRCPCPWADPR